MADGVDLTTNRAAGAELVAAGACDVTSGMTLCIKSLKTGPCNSSSSSSSSSILEHFRIPETASGETRFFHSFFLIFRPPKTEAIFHLTSEYCKLGKPHAHILRNVCMTNRSGYSIIQTFRFFAGLYGGTLLDHLSPVLILSGGTALPRLHHRLHHCN